MPSEPMLGQHLGKYHILEKLGQGGFAKVFRARDIMLEREIALKIPSPELLTDAMFVTSFRQEARTLAQLQHPSIVLVYDVGEIDGRLFIAMALVDGPNLAQQIGGSGGLSWGATLNLLRPIADALDYAHGQGIIHRDLKPSNILVDRESKPLISDFGLARVLSSSTLSVSRSSGIVGTPYYIAPELWDKDTATAASDVYALGCIVYEMLTGAVLFKGDTARQVMRAHDNGPQFTGDWPEDVPARVEGVLKRALAQEPAERYQSAGAFWFALQEVEEIDRADRGTALIATQVAGWREETEQALAEGNPSAAQKALGRWLALAPQDPDAQQMRARLDRLRGPSAPPHADNRPDRWQQGAGLGVWRPVAVLVGLLLVAAITLLSQTRSGAENGGPKGVVASEHTRQPSSTPAPTASPASTSTPTKAARSSPTSPASPTPPATAALATGPSPTAELRPTLVPPTSTLPPPTRRPVSPVPAPPAPTATQAPAPPTPTPQPVSADPAIVTGGNGALFRGSVNLGEIAASLGQGGSCIEGRVGASDNGKFSRFGVLVDIRGSSRDPNYDFLNGTYRLCGLPAGEWGVAVYSAGGVDVPAGEQVAHQVRVRLTGTPGEIAYINFRAQPGFAEPVATAAPTPGPYDGIWSGTLSGSTTTGSFTGRFRLEVRANAVYRISIDGPSCLFETYPNFPSGQPIGGGSFGVGGRPYNPQAGTDDSIEYNVSGSFSSASQASGNLNATQNGSTCAVATWSASK